MKTSSSPQWRAASALCILLGLLCFTFRASSAPPEKGKLVHIGMIWLKKPGNAAERRLLIEALHRFAREIPEVKSLSVGQPQLSASKFVDSSFDVCFTMEFDDQAAMERYAAHPVHEQAARDAFLPLAQKLLFYDFVTE